MRIIQPSVFVQLLKFFITHLISCPCPSIYLPTALKGRTQIEPMAPSVLSMQSVASPIDSKSRSKLAVTSVEPPTSVATFLPSLVLPTVLKDPHGPRRIDDWMNHSVSVPVFVFPFSLNPEAEMTSSERPASVPPHCASAFFSWLITQSYVTPRSFSSFSPLKNMHKRATCSSSTSPGFSYSLTRS